MENVLGEMDIKDLLYEMNVVSIKIIEDTEHIPHNVNERYGLSMILLLMMWDTSLQEENWSMPMDIVRVSLPKMGNHMIVGILVRKILKSTLDFV